MDHFCVLLFVCWLVLWPCAGPCTGPHRPTWSHMRGPNQFGEAASLTKKWAIKVWRRGPEVSSYEAGARVAARAARHATKSRFIRLAIIIMLRRPPRSARCARYAAAKPAPRPERVGACVCVYLSMDHGTVRLQCRVATMAGPRASRNSRSSLSLSASLSVGCPLSVVGVWRHRRR